VTDDLPGLDLLAVAAWLDASRPGLRAGDLSASVIVGGLSNLTYRVSDSRTTWALRRPPLGHVLSTAHDMAREYRVISALHGTAVPVAEPVVLCDDDAVIGAPFYLMGFVDGVVLDRPDVVTALTPDDARRSCELLVQTLLALHSVDPSVVGLDGFGRPDGYLQRQLARWTTQWEKSQTDQREGVEVLVSRLGAEVPVQSPAGIVHGDYRLTNVMFTSDISAIAAVVDWEMATVGDPLADVGLLVVYQTLAAGGMFGGVATAPSAGFLSPEEMVALYAAGSPRDLSDLRWYIAFGWFKLAVIAQGIHARFVQGKTVGAGFDQVGAQVQGLLDQSARALDGR
jgi:aminoglycoside phosphotransferase (APT) family kinase protein